ncbi:MAG TPA: peptidylprolyl isomerase [Ignavibacteriales bacterium]|nr:peptidylprolyl isomerase [Ignavibacteriales bacterium]
MQAKEGNVVKVHYTGRFDDGTIFDSSKGRTPLQFVIGNGQLIPGFENAVIGMAPGDMKSVNIAAAEGYGLYDENKVFEVSRNDFPDDINPEVGMELNVKNDDGSSYGVVIQEVKSETVMLDANHPLAGKDLIFEIELVEVKE